MIVWAIYDRQDDSQASGRLQTLTNRDGLRLGMTELVRTRPDAYGWQARGLQTVWGLCESKGRMTSRASSHK